MNKILVIHLITLIPLAGTDDYTSTMVNLTFNSGNQDDILCVNVSINNDTLCEANEMFNVALTTTDPTVTLDPDTGNVTIVDDDSKLYVCGLNNCKPALCVWA